MTTTLEPLPKLFPDFDSFVAGTMTYAEATAYCASNPGYVPYGLRKTNPATGVGESRFQVRKRAEPTIRERMDRIKKERAPKVDAEVRNGQELPKEGTTRRKIWDVYDRLHAEKGQFTKVDAAEVFLNFNPNTCGVVFSNWRAFHGFTWKLK